MITKITLKLLKVLEKKKEVYEEKKKTTFQTNSEIYLPYKTKNKENILL
jgi:hypothetical protein